MVNLFETFAGIGSQHKALTKNKQNFKIIGISEWYIDAIIAYKLIHYGDFNKKELNNINEKKMFHYLSKFTFSKDSKKPLTKEQLFKLNKEKLKMLYIANKQIKNKGSILNLTAKDFYNTNVLFYSFPCQDLSTAGKQEGIKQGTRSGLLLEIERILREFPKNRLPKYLIMENVVGLLHKKHYQSFLDFQKELEELGYKNTILKLNAIDFGVPQFRERIFMISELNGKTNININVLGMFNGTIGKFLDFDNSLYEEERKKNIPNDTKSRRIVFEKHKRCIKDYHSPFVYTITTKQDRYPNSACILHNYNIKGKSKFRLLTGREQLLLMGFEHRDYELLKKYFNDTTIGIFAGNSIVVNILQEIFKQLKI